MKKIGYEIIASAVCAFMVLVAAVLEACYNGGRAAEVFGAIKDIAASGVAFAVYFVAVKSIRENSRKNHDKLVYLDEFEKNKHEILSAADISPYYVTIFYGMQASFYSGDFEMVLSKVETALGRKTLGKECEAVLRCVKDVFSVFEKTECLQKRLSDNDYKDFLLRLSPDNEEWNFHEKHIKDKDLAAWCNIQRADMLEIVLENRVKFVCPEDKVLFEKTLAQAFETIRLLNRQVEKNSDDKYYAMLYRSYVNRNITLLYELCGDEENHIEFSREALKNRKELYEHYEKTKSYSDIIEDHIAHEYLLAMVEHCCIEKELEKKAELKSKSLAFYQRWTNKISLQKSIFERVGEKITRIDE